MSQVHFSQKAAKRNNGAALAENFRLANRRVLVFVVGEDDHYDYNPEFNNQVIRTFQELIDVQVVRFQQGGVSALFSACVCAQTFISLSPANCVVIPDTVRCLQTILIIQTLARTLAAAWLLYIHVADTVAQVAGPCSHVLTAGRGFVAHRHAPIVSLRNGVSSTDPSASLFFLFRFFI